MNLQSSNHVKKAAFFSALLYAMAINVSPVLSAPYWGTESRLSQPDGSDIQVKMFGDEFVGWYETPEGYTIVQDPATGWYCYAGLNADSTELVSSGIRVAAENLAADAKTSKKSIKELPKHLKIKPEKMREIREKKQKEVNARSAKESSLAPQQSPMLQQNLRVGNFIGITLLVDFSDDTATIPANDVDNFCNQPTGYTQFGNNGSVRQYYNDISGGKLTYTNVVPAFYYRAAHPKTYYTDVSIPYGQRAQELITEALTYLENYADFDFSTISHDPATHVMYAINCLYAGYSNSPWAQGLWPHAGGLWPTFSADGVSSGSYEITDMGSNLSIRTFIHENGHLLMGWPDLYDYGYESVGAGNYDIMAYGASDNNPVPTNPYFRFISGWENLTDITYAPNNTVFYHTPNSVSSYWYNNASSTPSNEFFAIESRRKTPGTRNAALPDSGLLIWHVDANGSNDNQQMTCASHYRVSVEQADGLFDLEHNANYGSDGDLFHAGGISSFTDYTSDNANWWCNTIDGNTRSNLSISSISGVGPTMSFTFRGATDISVTHPSMILRSSLPQSITVSAGYANLQVNLYSAPAGINQQQLTTSSGSAVFSVVANVAPDTIWVTVTGAGKRYRGAIVVTTSIPRDTTALVMGFEDASLWNVIVGSCTLSGSTTKTQGQYSMRIGGDYYRQFVCTNLKTNAIRGVTPRMAVDVYIGARQPNPYWIGQVQVYINCPSAGIYNQFIRHIDLTGLPLGRFSALTFELPANILSVLAGNYSDFSFSFALNTNANSGPYMMDNLRFRP